MQEHIIEILRKFSTLLLVQCGFTFMQFCKSWKCAIAMQGGSSGASPMAGTSCHRTQAAVLAIEKGLVAKELLGS
jgi:hypothetical protein